MYRQGHRGITLGFMAPVLWLLLEFDRPILAALSCGVFVVERLPDKDHRIPWIEHRGTSHSLTAALLVGVVCAGIGWLVATYVATPMLGEHTVREASLGPLSLGVIGFLVGFGGIVLHLLGDMLTIGGIQPLLPFNRRKIALTKIYADDPHVNVGLLILGVLAMVIALASHTPLLELVLSLL